MGQCVLANNASSQQSSGTGNIFIGYLTVKNPTQYIAEDSTVYFDYTFPELKGKKFFQIGYGFSYQHGTSPGVYDTSSDNPGLIYMISYLNLDGTNETPLTGIYNYWNTHDVMYGGSFLNDYVTFLPDKGIIRVKSKKNSFDNIIPVPRFLKRELPYITHK